MKILTVIFDLDKGGTQRAAQVFAEAYLELGHDSRILSMYDLGCRYEELKDKLIIWHGLTQEIKENLKKWDPDVVHLHSHVLKPVDVEAILQICDRSRIIETNVFSRPSPWAGGVHISFQLSNWAQWLFNLRGGRKYASAILPNPINCNAFKRASKQDILRFRSLYSIPEDAYVIGRIGQADIGSWSPVIVDVFDELMKNDQNIYLLLVNPPENIIEKASNSINKDNVVFVPKIIGDENLSIAYSAMNVMLHIVQKGETFGIVLTESILCETPVVTLSTPWYDNSQVEVVNNKHGGYVVNNKRNLSKVIEEIKSGKLEYNPSKGMEHIRSFEYISVAKRALQLANQNEEFPRISTRSILSILERSHDKPSILTKLLLNVNNSFLRQMTIYTAGYKGINDFVKSAYNHAIRLIS